MKNRVKILYPFALLALSSCASNYRAVHVDEAQAYVDTFLSEALAHGRSDALEPALIVDFEELNSAKENLAECSSPNVRLNKAVWAKLSQDDKEQLIFHELGHCLLGRGDETRVKDGSTEPVSLMYWQHFNSELYRRYRQYYLNELFRGAKAPLGT